MNKLLYFFCTLSLLLFNCKSRLDTQEFSNLISQKLKDWKLNNSADVQIHNKNMIIKIHYFGTEANSFYLDKETNNLILSMLEYHFETKLEGFEVVEYKLTFEGYPDIYDRKVNLELLKENKHNYQSAPKFYDFVEKSFEKLGYMEVTYASRLINYLNENKNNIFSFHGSYWNLLFEYSVACENKSESFNKVYNFIIFSTIINNLDNPVNLEIDRELFYYYIESCGYDRIVMSMDTQQIIEYLKHYTRADSGL